MSEIDLSKGSVQRPTNQEKYNSGWDAIFSKRKLPTDLAFPLNGSDAGVIVGQWDASNVFEAPADSSSNQDAFVEP